MNNNFLSNILKKKDKTISKDDIAKILKINPDTLKKFEEEYKKYTISEDSDNFFEQNSRSVSKEKHIIDGSLTQISVDTIELQNRIVEELLYQTSVYSFDGEISKLSTSKKELPENIDPVSVEEINIFPPEIRPQLSGNLIKRDINEDSHNSILYMYYNFLESRNPKKKKMFYNQFRQGLDILDLDCITYEIIGTNPNSMGYWFPKLVDACIGNGFFKIPKTKIAKVPITLLQLTRLEYQSLTKTTLDIVDKWAYRAFNLNKDKEYFIKTGTYSSKFDFRNAHVLGKKEVEELGEYLLFIHYQALQMASPLCTPCIYGVSTTNEWVVREWIKDKENNPCIYKGLPLHTEYRIFVDCDTKEIIGYTPYWEPKTMLQRFGNSKDSNSPHQIHDYIIYKSHEETITKRYNDNIDRVISEVLLILPNLNLSGQWSIDIMQNGEDFWIIDMAVAENSAFYNDCVPLEYRKPMEENWIPVIDNNI